MEGMSRIFSPMLNNVPLAANPGVLPAVPTLAPLADKIIRLVASLGSVVATGDVLLVLQAMRIETELCRYTLFVQSS